MKETHAKPEPGRPQLAQLQHWMQAVMIHADGVRAGVEAARHSGSIEVTVENVEQVIRPSQEMSSLARLQIYSQAYFGRLIECLQAQFPAVRHAIGDEGFNAMAFGYLCSNPSSNYTLATLGDSFASFLTSTRPVRNDPGGEPDFADFVIDLARLELTYAEVFSGRGPESELTLDLSQFEGLSPASFANCRLIPHSCVRLVQFRFPVHLYASAVRKGLEPEPVVAEPTSLAITRRDYVVRRYELDQSQYDLLNSLVRGETIGQSIQAMISHPSMSLDQALVSIKSWFQEWCAAPLFARLEMTSETDASRSG